MTIFFLHLVVFLSSTLIWLGLPSIRVVLLQRKFSHSLIVPYTIIYAIDNSLTPSSSSYFYFWPLGSPYPFYLRAYFFRPFISQPTFVLVDKCKNFNFVSNSLWNLLTILILNVRVIALVKMVIPIIFCTKAQPNLLWNFYIFHPKVDVDELLKNVCPRSIYECVILILRWG